MLSTKKRAALYLNEDLKELLKLYCVINEVSMSEFVEAAVWEKLERDDYKQVIMEYEKERFVKWTKKINKKGKRS